MQVPSDVASAEPSPGWRTRRRGIFEGLPRAGYRLTGTHYLALCVAGVLLHGLVVAAFGVALLVLFVDLSRGELVSYAVLSASAFLVEGAVAAVHLWRKTAAVRTWFGDPKREGATREAWTAAARLPLVLLRRPDLYLLGAAGAGAGAVVLARLLRLPVGDAVEVLPLLVLLYLSSVVLRCLGLELGMRPLLEAAGEGEPQPAAQLGAVSLHWRLVAAVPMVTWATGVIVSGILTDDTRELDRVGAASLVSLAVAAAVSVWLSLVLADAVSGPVVDLRDATRRVAAGDLTVRVPVVSTDETGQLASSFNAMVAGLDERERLRDALGVLVDPALAERVLAEGTDLQGEEVVASILFLDVRGFTAFAEEAAPREVVTALNELYELVVPVVLRHGGHANRFLGDGLLAVFGAPERRVDHASRAVAAATEIAQLVRARPGSALRVGMGIHSGPLVAGTVGGGGRRDFTVIGDTVNTAARVEAATRTTGDELLVTQSTLDELGPDLQAAFEERLAVPLKGKTALVRLHAPTGTGSRASPGNG